MPWKVSGVVEERARFVLEYQRGQTSMAELCRGYNISRKTGYKLWARFEAAGLEGLKDLSRAPHEHANAVAEEIEAQILGLRRAHMRWGPRKLKVVLERERPRQRWPATSTMGALLKREGLVADKRRRPKTPPYTQPFAAADAPNRVWCADFKGWCRAGDGTRIDPLTITDAHSRYLLRCQTVAKTDTEAVRGICEAAFREYGMPAAMHTDNGAPFASRAVAGLSRLSVWWMKLGIVPERIEPGHPEQNGRHERMHRTLKDETMQPPASNRRAQQRAFDRFRREYNEARPHEALGMQTPGSLYAISPRAYPARVPVPEYDSGFEVRRVQPHGEFNWKHQHVFLSETLAGEQVGFEPVDERYWCVYFAAFPIACFDSVERVVHRLPKSKE
jgi:transposase InsO family protein